MAAGARTASQKAYVRLARANASALIAAYLAMKDLQFQWNSLDYGSNLKDPVDVDVTEDGDRFAAATGTN